MKNFFKPLNFIVAVVFLMLIGSCNKTQTDADKRLQEEQQLRNYVAKNYAGLQPSASGLYFKSEITGNGNAPVDSDMVIINYTAWTLDGTVFDSTDTSIIVANNIIPLFALGGPLQYNLSVFPGWNEALLQMTEGGKAIALIPSILLYNDFVPRKYEFTLVKVIHNKAAYERQNIKDYLVKQGSVSIDSTNGIYYIETFTGSGSTPVVGSNVYFQYTGMLLDGRVFDQSSSSYNAHFALGTDSVIPGFKSAILKMKKGGKATVVIPYNQAYKGSYVSDAYNQILIPWYSTLLYNIQLVDIQ
jgi:FKBP-type peptidyl-prolyl cis-trans isomerase FkpA